MQNKAKDCLKLFLTFSKIGALTFGGGYAMIPHIQDEVVNGKKWITDDELLDIVSIAETTPGPIAINAATFIGKKVAGFWGAFCATLGVVLPSFLVILLIAFVLRRFASYRVVKYAFFGVHAGVLACIIKALITLFKKCHKGVFEYIIMAAAFAVVSFLNVKAIYAVIASGLLGLAVFLITKKGEKKKDDIA